MELTEEKFEQISRRTINNKMLVLWQRFLYFIYSILGSQDKDKNYLVL